MLSAKRRYQLVFELILIASVVFMSFFCIQKKAFFMDEGLSYSQSNHKRPWIPRLTAQQFCRSDPVFTTYLTVQPELRFHYEYLSNNLIAHPPFYYIIFHTISSFFPNTFSKWIGLVFNLLMFAITQILLYGLSRHFLPPKKAFLPLILYGFSVTTICTVTYIRNYMLFTAETTALMLLATYMVQFARDNQKEEFFKYMSAYVTVLLIGMMTHYYFFIIAFFLCAGLCLLMLKYRRYLYLSSFSGACLAIVLACPFIFPQMLAHMFWLEQSIPSSMMPAIVKNSSDTIRYLSVWNNMLNTDFLGGALVHTQYISCFLVLFLFISFLYTWLVRRNLNATLVLLCSVVVASVVVISLVDPMRMKRYYFPLMPMVCLLVVLGMNFILSSQWVEKRGGAVVQYIAVILVVLLNLRHPQFEFYLQTTHTPAGKFATDLKDKTLFIKWLDGGQSRWEMIIPGLYSFSAKNFIIFNEFSDDCYQKMMQYDRKNVALMTAYNGKCKEIDGWNLVIDDQSRLLCAYLPTTEQYAEGIAKESTAQ